MVLTQPVVKTKRKIENHYFHQKRFWKNESEEQLALGADTFGKETVQRNIFELDRVIDWPPVAYERNIFEHEKYFSDFWIVISSEVFKLWCREIRIKRSFGEKLRFDFKMMLIYCFITQSDYSSSILKTCLRSSCWNREFEWWK